jgi:hypothetical protein
MTQTLPRSVILIGTPLLLTAFVAALWAWERWGFAVFFDMAADGVPFCQ